MVNVGFIAQELEKVFPDFVNTPENGMKAVSYQALIPVLVKGMQEQADMINALKLENETLIKKVFKLEKYFYK